MELLLRILIISFPFVFAGALFWPAIEDRFVSPAPIAEEAELGSTITS